ncbi:MAG: redoxin family protein [Phycisphaerae bacterium]|nr:redoxin family protein [Phycisphaerae bacterium]
MVRSVAVVLVLGSLAVMARGQESGQPVPIPDAQVKAQPEKLAIGDVAPPLFIEQWVKGGPIESFEPGKVYVVEFWATWCPPCRASIPHLTKLQREFEDRGVRLIGVSSSETKGLDDVVPFVERMGDAMAYAVAWDRDGKTSSAWMEASGQLGIPTAFVVNAEGRLVWIGHPLDRLGKVLQEVLDGRLTVRVAMARAERKRTGEEIIGRAQAAWSSGQKEQALLHLDEVIALDPEQFGLLAGFKTELLLKQMSDPAGALVYGRGAIDGVIKDQALALGEIASVIIDSATKDEGLLALAGLAAERAVEVSGGSEPLPLATLARVKHLRGEREPAVELMTKAIELAADDMVREQLKEWLEAMKQP